MSLGLAFKGPYLRVLIGSQALEGITSHSSALIGTIALISVSPYLLAHFAPLSKFNTVALLERRSLSIQFTDNQSHQLGLRSEPTAHHCLKTLHF